MRTTFSVVCLVMAGLWFSDVVAQTSDPFRIITKTYTKDVHQGDAQIFDIDQGANGLMYFANKIGLLEYDGVRWRTLSPKLEQTEVRTVKCTEDLRIYIGGNDFFGYFLSDSISLMQYHALEFSLPKGINAGRIQHICTDSLGNVFFQSPERVFKYDGSNIQVIDARKGHHFRESFSVDGNYYVTAENQGLLCYQGNGLALLHTGGILDSTQISGYFKISGIEYLLIDGHGLFKVNNSLERQNLESLETLSFYRSIQVLDKYISIGTMGKGILLYDDKFELKFRSTKDVVNAQFIDLEGNLWIGSNKNIRKITINSNVTKMELENSEIGTVEDIELFNNSMYLATSNGVYYESKVSGTDQFIKIPELDIDCYDLLCFNRGNASILLIATVNHVYSYTKDRQLTQLVECGPWKLGQNYQDSNRVIIANYNGLSSLTWNGTEFVDEGYVSGFEVEIFNFIFNKKGDLFLGALEDGLFQTSSDFFSKQGVPVSDISAEAGIEKGSTCLTLIQDTVYAGAINGLYRLIGDQWESVELKNVAFDEYGLHRIVALPNGETWANIYEATEGKKWQIGRIVKIDGVHRWERDDFAYFNSDMVHGINVAHDGAVWLGGVSNIFRYKPNELAKESATYNTLIRKMVWGEQVVYAGAGNGSWKNDTASSIQLINKLPYSNNRIVFEYASTSFSAEELSQYSHWLEGQDESWTPWSSEAKYAYTNLAEGKYVLHVRSKNFRGQLGRQERLSFTILAPWYRTTFAYVGYAVGLLLLIFTGIKLGTRRVRKKNEYLEEVVKERTQEVVEQKNEIEEQKTELQELYTDVTDSIRYAKRLQDSILPPDSYVKKLFPDSFVYFQPKDIVSGDFYWAGQQGNKNLIAAVDCTGHGVPGAFMSLVGANGLNGAVGEHGLDQTEKILDDLNHFSFMSLNNYQDGELVRDGMDMAMVAIDWETKVMEFAGANNPMYLLRNGEIQVTKSDKMAIGSFQKGEAHFTRHQFDLESGDIVYLFSDGYADQFGGDRGKKYMYKRFRETLIELSQLPMEEQADRLKTIMENWMGGTEQVDDILVIGIRVA
jgi:serine phosphatase RsbU (regulator of sigma subunit)